MKKISLTAVGLVSILPILKVSSFSNSTQLNVAEIKQSNNFMTYENEESEIEYININGRNFGKERRVYINSSGNKSLPEISKNSDYLIGKGEKDAWYGQNANQISLDITDYAENKEDFLNRYGFLTLSYQYSSGLWNGLDKWSQDIDKDSPFKFNYYNLELSNKTETVEIFYHNDISHSSNERTKINLIQSWNENILSINISLNVWYSWAWGSIYNV